MRMAVAMTLASLALAVPGCSSPGPGGGGSGEDIAADGRVAGPDADAADGEFVPAESPEALCAAACREGGDRNLFLAVGSPFDTEAEREHAIEQCAPACVVALNAEYEPSCEPGFEAWLRCAESCGWQDCPETACLPEVRQVVAHQECVPNSPLVSPENDAFSLFAIRIVFRAQDGARMVSAYPARQVERDGETVWERACAAPDPEGFLFNTVYLSTARDTHTDGSVDRDNSIRPGDAIHFRPVGPTDVDDPEMIRLDSPEAVEIELDCQEGVSDANPNSCAGSAPSLTMEHAGYREFASQRRQGHDVLLVIDQSGSMAGLVDGETLQEGLPQNVGANIPPNFGQLASDRNNVRLTAAKRFVSTLNAEDRLGVVAFGEGIGGLEVPCASPDVAGLSDDEVLETCFGTDRDFWVPPADARRSVDGGIYYLGSGETGRANLWEAVEFAYDFLAERDDPERTRHVVVLTDGPDTCTLSRSYTTCESQCSGVTFEDVRDKILADQEDPNPLPVHVHFVQFEAPGYEGRDPRQMELSCHTEGHYQFINSNDFSNDNLAAFQQALEAAMLHVRYSLMGWWQVAASSQGFESDAAMPTGTPRGSLYALSGTLTVEEESGLVVERIDGELTPVSKPFAFGVGAGGGAGQATQWDRRPVIRKACTGAVDCGASSEPGTCSEVCSTTTGLCLDGSDAVEVPDTAPCTTEDGAGGVCCDGACNPAGSTCPACQ